MASIVIIAHATFAHNNFALYMYGTPCIDVFSAKRTSTLWKLFCLPAESSEATLAASSAE